MRQKFIAHTTDSLEVLKSLCKKEVDRLSMSLTLLDYEKLPIPLWTTDSQ